MKEKGSKRLSAFVVSVFWLLVLLTGVYADSITNAMKVHAAAAADAYLAEFLNSGYDAARVTIYDGSNEESSFMMNGRKYYQGLVIGKNNYENGGSITFNVEEITTLQFTLGRIDNTQMNDVTLYVYRDGELWQEIAMGSMEIWKELSFDVSAVSTLKLSITKTYSQYGLGNFCVDDYAPSKTYESPVYESAVDFINSQYDAYRTTTYDASNEAGYFMMDGRKYYQGIVIGKNNYENCGSLTFNVENVESLRFTLGRVDSTEMNGITFKIYRDGDWWQDIAVGNIDTWKEVELDVSEISTIRFSIGETYCQYAMGDIEIDSFETEKAAQTPVYTSAMDFINSRYDAYRTTAYDGSNESEYFMMNGRKYYQGIVIGKNNYENCGSMTFNVENVETLRFTLGRVDSTEMNDITFKIYRDGDWWQDIAVGNMDTWKEVELDVSEISVIRFYIGENYCQYAMGDIEIDSFESEMPAQTPVYTSAVDFINSRYDAYRTTAYDGSNEANYFMMDGRKYYQGIVIGKNNYESCGSMTFNVENVETLRFTLGRIDNTQMTDVTLKVYRDGFWWQDIAVGNMDTWKEVELDVSEISVIRFYIGENYCQYAMGDIEIDSFESEMPAQTPVYKSAVDFINSRYDAYRTTAYDGSNELNYFTMNGRKYYQGIVIGKNNYESCGSLTFNVENVETLRFTLGRIDNTQMTDVTLKVYRDGFWWQDIAVGSMETWKEVELDVSEISVIRFYIGENYCQYAMGDIEIDSFESEMPATSPVYEGAVDFINSRYDAYRNTAYDGSNKFNYYMMDGKEYYQGVVIGKNNYEECGSLTFNVENVDSVTFTFGRIDSTKANDIILHIMKDGVLYYDLEVSADSPAKEYIIDTTETSVLRFYITNNYVQYAMANIALNSDYSEFTDGTYEVEQEVYTDPSKIISIDELKKPALLLGDINFDGKIDATDAARLLVAAAAEGSSGEKILTDEQRVCAELNGDGMCNAVDASLILRYAAYVGSGGTDSIVTFLENLKQ